VRRVQCLAAAVANLTLLAANSDALSVPGSGWPLMLLVPLLTLSGLLSPFGLTLFVLRPAVHRPASPSNRPDRLVANTLLSAALLAALAWLGACLVWLALWLPIVALVYVWGPSNEPGGWLLAVPVLGIAGMPLALWVCWEARPRVARLSSFWRKHGHNGLSSS
jgi:hypothetical protein